MSSILFVTGRMRSGTTMLCNFLDHQPAITMIADSLRVPSASLNAFKKRVDNSMELADVSRERLWRAFVHVVGSNPSSPSADRDLIDHYQSGPGRPEFATHAELYERLATDLAALRGTPDDVRYFGTKATRGENLAVALARLGHKSIIILRDPRAVFVSALVRSRTDDAFPKPDLDNFVAEWRHSFLNWKNSGDCLAIRYEDFVRDPAEVDRIGDYLGLDLDPNARIATKNSSFGDTVTGSRRPEAIDRWRTFDDQKQIRRIEASLAPSMRESGYL